MLWLILFINLVTILEGMFRENLLGLPLWRYDHPSKGLLMECVFCRPPNQVLTCAQSTQAAPEATASRWREITVLPATGSGATLDSVNCTQL